MTSPAGARALTIGAAAFLAFDGVALMVGGLWLHRPLLVIVGAVLVVGSMLVGLSWHWYRRQAAEISRARHALASEAREMQELIRRN